MPQELFRPFGHVQRIYLAVDRATGESRGFAFVTFTHRQAWGVGVGAGAGRLQIAGQEGAGWWRVGVTGESRGFAFATFTHRRVWGWGQEGRE